MRLEDAELPIIVKVPMYAQMAPYIEEFLDSGKEVQRVVLEDGDPELDKAVNYLRSCVQKKFRGQLKVTIQEGNAYLVRKEK